MKAKVDSMRPTLNSVAHQQGQIGTDLEWDAIHSQWYRQSRDEVFSDLGKYL